MGRQCKWLSGQLASLLLIVLASCLPQEASWSWGLGSSQVRAVISDDHGKLPQHALVVVYRYHHSFIHLDGTEENSLDSSQKTPLTSGVPLRNISTKVSQPLADEETQGIALIPMPKDVVEMEMLFIAPGHLTKVFKLRRQLGMGDVLYRAKLDLVADWRSHYYTYLVPRLQPLVAGDEYRLSAVGQQILGDWLRERGQELEKNH